jgi:Fur family transcriptional regulator, peroxide stress response regulator
MTSSEILTTTLKRAGMRITPQRIAICKLLSESKEHPTAAMIYEDIRQQYPSLSLATVYNTLEVLVDLGSINVLGHSGDGNVHYDADTSPHINLACISCHKIVDLASPLVANLDHEVSHSSGYKLVGARVMYYGLCPDCQNLSGQQDHH